MVQAEEGRAMVLGFGKKDPVVNPADGGTVPVTEDIAAVRADIRKSRGRASKVAEQAALDAQLAELDQLYEAENWEEVGSIYFDMRFVQTSYEPFRLSPSEKGRLGVALAATMKLLIRLDPRYVAMLVFTVNFGSILARKEASWAVEKKKRAGKVQDDGHGPQVA
jgi:hypothetical protein